MKKGLLCLICKLLIYIIKYLILYESLNKYHTRLSMTSLYLLKCAHYFILVDPRKKTCYIKDPFVV